MEFRLIVYDFTYSIVHLFGKSNLILNPTDVGLQLENGKVEVIHILM